MKPPKTIRVCSVNVNSLGLSKHSPKDKEIKQFIDTYDVDIMCLTEVNVKWSLLEAEDKIWDRTSHWFENIKLGVGFNTNDPNALKHQPGGTVIIARDKIALTCVSGSDESKLGRWSWVIIKGANGLNTRVVSAYSPSGSGRGPATVYSQHLSVLQNDPTQTFWDDLGLTLSKWIQSGEQVILTGDWNEDVSSSNITQWMRVFGLSECILERHGQHPPPTYQRGTNAIDGIFCSLSCTAKKSGYLPFNSLPGDHRGIWADFSHSSVLGFNMNNIPPFSRRRLQLRDPRVVKKYLRYLHHFLSKNKVYDRIDQFRQSISQSLTPAQSLEYDAIDKIRIKGMMWAEKKCKKIRVGHKQWSPKLQRAMDQVKLWSIVLKSRLGCNISKRSIIRLSERLKIDTKGKSIRHIKGELKNAKSEYSLVSKKYAVLRLSFLEDLAIARAKEGKIKASTEIKALRHREAQRFTARKIKSALGKSKGSGTTKIVISTENGNEEITDPKLMVSHIIAENVAKFHQTRDWSELHRPEIIDDLGLMGEGPEVEAVLAGEYVPSIDLTQYTESWLHSMKLPNCSAKVDKTSLKSYAQGWKKVKEATATGSAHVGHFKAGMKHPQIATLHYWMSMIPMLTGYSPKRWRQGTDVMLLKKPGNFHVEKLRTIVLYEADYNHENKRIGRDAMRAAKELNLIAPEQYSCKGRSSQDNALHKRLVFDYFRFHKHSFGMCACDLKSCYDRIIHSAAAVALRRVGVSQEKIQCMFETVQRLVHKIRTAYGISEDSYGGEETSHDIPAQGTGQGSGSAPTIWSILSSTIFYLLRKKGFSVSFCMALSRGLLKLCGFAYVDDCDLVASAPTIQQTALHLQ